MPLDTTHLPRPISPAVSDDKSTKRDKSFRRYASAVERALSLFDTALQEWADYISFLGRLLKALQTKPTGITEVPHTAVVAKRLAQCLSPMLPSGVHQKAIEVYNFVFSTLGKDGLSKDLPLYLPGLSPLLSFASLSVKPGLLSLFENFIVVLDPAMLQPALKAIILALLPGLEDETSEEFERTHNLLNRVKDAVGQGRKDDAVALDVAGDRYFWQSLFLAAVTSSSRRQGALAYLARNLPRMGSYPSSGPNCPDGFENNSTLEKLPPEIEAVISPEPGLLIRCFAVGLRDDQLLIQRGFLDLLVTHLPLGSVVLHDKVGSNDREILTAAAASVVARREMGLNRRLWAWFLGPGTSADIDDTDIPPSNSPDPNDTLSPSKPDGRSQGEYFEQFGLVPLINSLRKMVASPSLVPSEKARPFRICLSLMDRSEIGGLVVPQIFAPAMESVWRYEKSAPSKEAAAEVLRSAGVFFDGIESGLIWGELIHFILTALDFEDVSRTSSKLTEEQMHLHIVLFIITKFNIREEEMLAVHIPAALLTTLLCVRRELAKLSILPDDNKARMLRMALKISIHLLELVPERVFAMSHLQKTRSIGKAESAPPPQQIQLTLELIKNFYKKDGRNLRGVPPIPSEEVGNMLLENVACLVVQALQSLDYDAYLQLELSFFNKLLRKVPDREAYDHKSLLSSLARATDKIAASQAQTSTFAHVAGLVSVFETLSTALPIDSWISDHLVRQIVSKLIQSLWPYISPLQPTHSVEAVRSLWRIQSVSPDTRLVEGSIASLMFLDTAGKSGQHITLEGARHFTTLWIHSVSALTSSHHRSNLRRSLRKANQKSLGTRNDSIMLARPLLLLLDSLMDSGTELATFTASWLQSLPTLQVIIELLLRRLLNSSQLAESLSWNTITAELHGPEAIDDAVRQIQDCLYYLQTVSSLIKSCPESARAPMTGRMVVTDPSKQADSGNVSTESSKTAPDPQESEKTIQVYLTQLCLNILEGCIPKQNSLYSHYLILRQTSVALLEQLLLGPSPAAILNLGIEHGLLRTLASSVEQSDILLQLPLMNVILVVLKAQFVNEDLAANTQRRPNSRETTRSVSQMSISTEKIEKGPADQLTPPDGLLDCLQLGLSSPGTQIILEHWVRFMDSCMIFYPSNAFQILMPLVGCFKDSIESVFDTLQRTFADEETRTPNSSEPINTLNVLLNGLEQVLARGHGQLIQDEVRTVSVKIPEQPQGFFGNMVSGVFTSETQRQRPPTASNHLIVILCFKDAVKLSFKMWSWGDVRQGNVARDTMSSASFTYTSIRLRNRTRRILEHLFAAEALECLETLVEAWHKDSLIYGLESSGTIFNLLHALEASRPKHAIPAIFNAIYSRTNPNVLDPARKSTLTSDLSDVTLAGFLVAYTRSMEDDALDEIWADCLTFLKDVLGNPMPHRQILPLLLEFIAILGEKIDNTNFGEQRKMRREIADLFVRLLSATFTIKPLAFPRDASTLDESDKSSHDASISSALRSGPGSRDVVSIMASALANISRLLVETDRVSAATATISTQILQPTFRWKTFPLNVSLSTLRILEVMSRIPEAAKTWKRDVAEAFNDQRFFCNSTFDLAETGWMPILRQWTIFDKDRVPEFLSRLPAPTSAGLVFGVGASSARLEADRKAQLNLRRIAFLMLAGDNDTFAVNLGGIQDKLVELMSATITSSPSSTTRAEVYMLLRTMTLKISPIHLASLWPLIHSELYETLSALHSKRSSDVSNVASVMQAAKLLDTLLIIGPEDFQLREWLYIMDTTDAVDRPSDRKPIALVDGLTESLDNKAVPSHSATILLADNETGIRRPLLQWNLMKHIPRDNQVDQVLRPFLRQLSISAFESTYQMETADRSACCEDLLRDLFDETTLV